MLFLPLSYLFSLSKYKNKPRNNCSLNTLNANLLCALDSTRRAQFGKLTQTRNKNYFVDLIGSQD